jgi:hypothetical protein
LTTPRAASVRHEYDETDRRYSIGADYFFFFLLSGANFHGWQSWIFMDKLPALLRSRGRLSLGYQVKVLRPPPGFDDS